jgi:hypothetical protein
MGIGISDMNLHAESLLRGGTTAGRRGRGLVDASVQMMA